MTFGDLRALTNPFVAQSKPEQAPNMESNSDVRPTTQQWVIREGEGGTEALRMRWGLVPYWFKGPTLKEFKLTTFNAKAETVATAAAYKGAYARRRCLVPADGWYEWTGAKGAKQRHLFTPKGGGPLTFAGLWEGGDRRTVSRWRASPSSPSQRARR